jgi:beta-lactamase class A
MPDRGGISMPGPLRAATLALILLLPLAPVARADGGDDGIPAERPAANVNLPDRAPLWSYTDPTLQRGLEASLSDLGLAHATREQNLAVSLVDITDVRRPRVAAVNGDHMMYAASLPKIAVLLGAFERIAEGSMGLDEETEASLTRMIRVSSDEDAAAMMQRVGKPFIADVLQRPRYRLYDPKHDGGLWAGKDYASAGLWRRDPIHDLSHGATAMQVARFYYLLETGNLVSPEASRKMKEILSKPGLEHKFVAGLAPVAPDAQLYRKSGTWAQWHSDSAIVEHGDRKYIAVALSESPDGGHWMREIIVALDHLILEGGAQRVASAKLR